MTWLSDVEGPASRVVPFMVLLLGGLLCPSPVDAIPLIDLWIRGAEIKIETWTGTLTQSEEDAANVNLLNERRAQQGLPPLPVPQVMGQAYTNDDLSAHTQSGQSVVLSYQLLDINTGLPVADPFGIASVRYDAHTDLSLPPAFSVLGTSADSANNFAFDWVVSGFEPMIKATPLDVAGREIQVIGPDNDNTLIGTGFQTYAVPEPSLFVLVSTGLLSLYGVSRRQKHERKR